MNTNDLSSLASRVKRLEDEVFGEESKQLKAKHKQTKDSIQELDFTLNIRAFMKKYAVNKSGPKKFVLLLACLTKGEVNVDIKKSEIMKHWKTMDSKKFLGEFNGFYANAAKTRGWVNPKKHGTYCLSPHWKKAYE